MFKVTAGQLQKEHDMIETRDRGKTERWSDLKDVISTGQKLSHVATYKHRPAMNASANSLDCQSSVVNRQRWTGD